MKRILLVLLAAGLSLNMISCNNSYDKSDKPNVSITKNITIDEAIDNALSKVDNTGRVVSASYDDDVISCYDICIIVENTMYDVRIDGSNGEVIKTEYYPEKRVEIPTGIISITEAEEAALKEAGKGEVEEIQLKSNENTYYYYVKIADDSSSNKVKINAFDKSIMK